MHRQCASIFLAHDGCRAHVCDMSRRKFLTLVSGATLSACATALPSAVATSNVGALRVRAVTFDLFTLFDPRGVDSRVREILGNRPDFVATWKTKLFEYSWLRAASSQYRDFQ